MLIRKMPHTMFMYAKIDKGVLRFRNKYLKTLDSPPNAFSNVSVFERDETQCGSK
jgi:hypothetical protein